MRSVSHLLVLAALGGLVSFGSLHCGASGTPEPGGDGGADAGATLSGDAGPEGSTERGPDVPPSTNAGLEAGTLTPGPLVESNLLVLANGSNLPAFRLCPAVAPGVVASDSLARPIPEVLMPGSSLEGVPERGAVGIAPPAAMFGTTSVVVLWIDEKTKAHPGLISGTCETLSCVGGGSGCLDDGTGPEPREPRVTVVDLPNDAALDKKGILVLKGATRATARFETRTPRQSTNATVGKLDVQLFDEANFGRGVTFQGTAIDGSVAGGIPYSGFGGAFVAGTHRETMLEVHGNSAPRRPVVDFYANPGLFALFLLGAPGDLTFVAVPTHR
ncbi:MAG: hypothetical protein IPQ09_21790 [Myxococcales bacterium]|nr:hypothetical protein [Myxococcales bacterium]